ncbi:hypothetical protein B0T24DRAFT_596139 [Lasiosphaeria ovina]|uniref:Uncharacterized protein n=1 Tax=Lasiosphaeria ovina TaxID=92902 RepID=A0AAE0K4P3_9PEZI|nr:hypothetical protein B0T24DRAFT_596139 [Lasiosphaeria ovina]
MCGDDQQSVSLVARELLKRFSGRFLVVFDDLDDPLIDMQRYLFTGLKESKETDARRRIVNELRGLPVAITTVGAALRKKDGIPAINSQAYLAWADEAKDILLDDPMFSNYPSVWKAFQFAFQRILQGTENQQYAVSMALFIASCEKASSLAEYIRLYRDFRNAARTRSAASSDPPAIRQLRFLETGIFDLAIRALAAVNMVTVNWMEATPNDAPYIEMHSLIGRWLKRTNHHKVLTYTGSKIWLLGFGMYGQLRISRVGISRFKPLLKEASKILVNDPETIQDNIARGLGEQIEYAVRNDALNSDYALKDVFLDTIDSHGCIPIAFSIEAPYQLSYVGHTDAFESIKADITARTESLLTEHLAQEAFRQFSSSSAIDSGSFIRTWSSRWESDVEEIIRRCLAEVFIKLQSVADTQHLATELPSPSTTAAVADAQSFSGYMRSLSNLSDSRNAFFAVLRRVMTAASEQYLESTSVLEELDSQKDTFRDICERAVRVGFGDRASSAFHSQLLSAEAGPNTIFAMLWELAWPARFLGDLGSLIAQKTFDAVSGDLKKAAKQGFSNVFESPCNGRSSSVEDLAYEIFSASAIGNLFPNWITSGWIDPLSDDEDSDDTELDYTSFLQESKRQIVSAMSGVYDGDSTNPDSQTERA